MLIKSLPGGVQWRNENVLKGFMLGEAWWGWAYGVGSAWFIRHDGAWVCKTEWLRGKPNQNGRINRIKSASFHRIVIFYMLLRFGNGRNPDWLIEKTSTWPKAASRTRNVSFWWQMAGQYSYKSLCFSLTSTWRILYIPKVRSSDCVFDLQKCIIYYKELQRMKIILI